MLASRVPECGGEGRESENLFQKQMNPDLKNNCHFWEMKTVITHAFDLNL